MKYGNSSILREFNDQLQLGSKLSRYIQKENVVTVEDEVYAKLNVLIEKAQTVLDMFPNNLHLTVVLLEDQNSVSAVYFQKYGKKVDHIAYYSLSEKTVYLSIADVNMRVLAHELGHAIVDHYFRERPPYHIHELMAQFTEKHITD